MAAGDVHQVVLNGANYSGVFGGQIGSDLGERRSTGSGDVRLTLAGNTRIVSVPTNKPHGRLFLVALHVTLFYHHAGDWLPVTPQVRHNGTWKTPRQIHIKESGAWRTVQTPTPAE